MALTTVRRLTGFDETARLRVVPDPTLDVGVPVRVKRWLSKVDGVYLVERIELSLGPEAPMTVTAQRQRGGD